LPPTSSRARRVTRWLEVGSGWFIGSNYLITYSIRRYGDRLSINRLICDDQSIIKLDLAIAI
jgi:hypothetical protein